MGYMEHKEESAGALPTEINKKFDDLMSALGEMRQKSEEGMKDVVRKTEVDAINAAINTLKSEINTEIAKLKRPALLGSTSLSPEQAEYSQKFEDWFRNGEDNVKKTELRALEVKANQVQVNADGGFTVRPEMETAIDAVVKEYSPIRQIADVMTIGSASYKKLVSQRGANSGWVGEGESRPQTNTSQLSELEFPVFEMYANPYATQQILDDSVINIDQWISDEVAEEFAQKEGAAFVAGNGVKKPQGFLSYPIVANASWSWGNIGYIATGVSGDFAASNKADQLLQLIYGVKAAYRQGSSFVMNRTILGEIRQFKDGQGLYIAGPRLTDAGLIESIFQAPVTEAEDMPVKAANSLSIAFGNFKRGYKIIDRVGVRVLRDPYSAKPYVSFYTTKRVGGGVQNFEAIKLLRFATS